MNGSAPAISQRVMRSWLQLSRRVQLSRATATAAAIAALARTGGSNAGGVAAVIRTMGSGERNNSSVRCGEAAQVPRPRTKEHLHPTRRHIVLTLQHVCASALGDGPHFVQGHARELALLGPFGKVGW
jgi:hypothetical protein